MTTPARFLRLVGIIGLVCWLGMIGWAAKTGLAQNGGPAPLPMPGPKPEGAAKAEASNALLPPPPITPVRAASPASAPEVAALPAAMPEQTSDKQTAASRPGPEAGLSPVASEPKAAEPTIARLPSAEPGPATANDDPELSAQSFVERNEKEAEERLKALTAEAEQLRARLNKLESGIKKWENLVNALKTAQQGPVTSTAVTAGAEDAGDLEPIRPGTQGAARGKEKVKWATASGSGTAPPAASGAAAQPPAPAEEPPPAASPTTTPAEPPAQAQVPAARPARPCRPPSCPGDRTGSPSDTFRPRAPPRGASGWPRGWAHRRPARAGRIR